LEEFFVDTFSNYCLLFENDYDTCLKMFSNVHFLYPLNPIINYNLGLFYLKVNDYSNSIIHYKLAINSAKNKELLINCYNGLASTYRISLKWNEALYFLRKGLSIFPLDPNLNNQMGVILTEFRRTDLAEKCYLIAIDNYMKTFIHKNEKEYLLSEIYLNYGQMTAYNGDNKKSIELYNTSLKSNPTFLLPFQNKIMNLNYLFDLLKDKMYITNQHKNINKLLNLQNVYDVEKKDKFSDKIKIGFVSGDLLNHPVGFFTKAFLQNFDKSKYSVICYSQSVIDANVFKELFPNVELYIIKNLNTKEAADLVYNHYLNILFDLSGHTAQNRLDIFAYKPTKIQISWIGYPFTTGLNTIDYRITDNCVDNKEISQPFYTEKLLFIKDCFLCYDIQPAQKDFKSPLTFNGPIKIACFNRVNKITDSCINLYIEILKYFKGKVHIVFKTKALLNETIKNEFLNKFESVKEWIEILNCTTSHSEHIETYNHVHLSIDTFPYSGTTTSCESLSMGTPVLTLKDTINYFHPQNVTSSLLENSNLSEYICYNKNDMIQKISKFIISKKNIQEFKSDIKSKFINGKVCNVKLFLKNFDEIIDKVQQ
jgi:protein O-GlcNAc transferase